MARIDFQKNDTYRNAYDGMLRLTKHVSSVDELPEIGPSNGDIYSVGEDNSLYIYNGSWSPMGSGGGTTEHIVVYGTVGEDKGGRPIFVPDDEQPTFSEAVEAFESVAPVTLVVSSGDYSVSARVLCHGVGQGLNFLVVSIWEDYVCWYSGESDQGSDPGSDPQA